MGRTSRMDCANTATSKQRVKHSTTPLSPAPACPTAQPSSPKHNVATTSSTAYSSTACSKSSNKQQSTTTRENETAPEWFIRTAVNTIYKPYAQLLSGIPYTQLDHIPPRHALDAIDTPTLLFHGRDDTIVPVRHAQHNAAPDNVDLLLVPDKGHCPALETFKPYRDEVNHFLPST